MLTNVVNYLYHLVMGRLMGPVEYGVLASLYSILYIISIVPMSTSFAMVKFVSSAKNEKELSSVYLALKKFVFKLALVGMLVVLLLSPVIFSSFYLWHYQEKKQRSNVIFITIFVFCVKKIMH